MTTIAKSRLADNTQSTGDFNRRLDALEAALNLKRDAKGEFVAQGKYGSSDFFGGASCGKSPGGDDFAEGSSWCP